MKIHKLTLLFIALVSVHLNNAMDDQKTVELKLTILGTKYGQVFKLDHRNFPPDLRRQLIQYSYTSNLTELPTITVNYNMATQQYSGNIEKNQAGTLKMLNQIKIKTIFERLEAQFNAALNQINTKK